MHTQFLKKSILMSKSTTDYLFLPNSYYNTEFNRKLLLPIFKIREIVDKDKKK